MNMKIHKGSTSCNCIGGAGSWNGCGCGYCGGGCGHGGGCGCGSGAMVCIPLSEYCGCYPYPPGPLPPTPFPIGEVASSASPLPQPLMCNTAIGFGANTSELGTAVTHVPGSANFVVNTPGNYLISYTAHITGAFPGSSATFQIAGKPETASTATTGLIGSTGTAQYSGVHTLAAGENLSLIPVSVAGGEYLDSATISIKRVS